MATVRAMTQIIIPTTNLFCPASNALSREGILIDAVVMQDDYHYSRLLTDLWKRQESFIIVEHDVVPWPGAIYSMLDCPEQWCAYSYPRAPGDLIEALGCIFIDESLIKENVDLHKYWNHVAWNQLDGAVISQLLRVGYKPHVHTPPVAHAKA